MNTAGERLRMARINSGFPFAARAADNFGWNLITYRAHENGHRKFSYELAERYAKAFKVDVQWLITGERTPSNQYHELSNAHRELIKIYDSLPSDKSRIAIEMLKVLAAESAP